MPAFNEEANVDRAVGSAAKAAASLVSDWEVVVVDDGSRDGTAERLEALTPVHGERLRILRHGTNLGYGAALRAGFQASRGDWVFYTDSDNQFDLQELKDFVPLLEENDAVLGYRIDRKDPALRRFTSTVFNSLSSFVFGMSVRDLNCSFKLFKGSVLRGLPLESADFFIDTEMVARLHQGGFRYVQRGVHHYPRLAGHSTVRMSDVPKTLASLARMRRRLRAAPSR
jgi:glycosyltransferase involved in cell wall biosynthesis